MRFCQTPGLAGSTAVVLNDASRVMKYLYFDPDEHPISAQLFGSDPEVMARAAAVCEDLGFDFVDINFANTDALCHITTIISPCQSVIRKTCIVKNITN